MPARMGYICRSTSLIPTPTIMVVASASDTKPICGANDFDGVVSERPSSHRQQTGQRARAQKLALCADKISVVEI